MTGMILATSMLAALAWAASDDRPSHPPYQRGDLLFRDDFDRGLDQWTAELEAGGVVKARDGQLAIDVPAGCTLWFRPLLEGPVEISYEATVVSAGGPNDRVSDLNCFWMARDVRCWDDLFERPRSGQFADYHQLKGYYVGHGGNSNTTTRFRRYIGDAELRPLLPEHDLRDPQHLLVPNRPQQIRIVAFAGLIQYFRDDQLLFTLQDPEPYTNGWFGLRTVNNHMTVRAFRVHRLVPTGP